MEIKKNYFGKEGANNEFKNISRQTKYLILFSAELTVAISNWSNDIQKV